MDMYVICTYMFINKYICMYMVTVQTRLYSFTTILHWHFPSGQISLVTQASLSSAQAPLLQPESSLLPVIRSLLN